MRFEKKNEGTRERERTVYYYDANGGLCGLKGEKKKEREIKVCICTHLTFTTIDRVKRKKFFFNSWKFSFFFPITPKWVENEEVKTNEIPVS